MNHAKTGVLEVSHCKGHLCQRVFVEVTMATKFCDKETIATCIHVACMRFVTPSDTPDFDSDFGLKSDTDS